METMSDMTTEEGYETTKYNINKSFEIAYSLCEDFLAEYRESEEYKTYCKAEKEWKSTELNKLFTEDRKELSLREVEKMKEESEAYQAYDKAEDDLAESRATSYFLGRLSMVEKIYNIDVDNWKSKRWVVK